MNTKGTPGQEGQAGQAGRGRPRSSKVHRQIIDATLSLLTEVGVERLSIEMVAQRAGVGKTSIYRRWSNKEALVVDAIATLKPDMDTTAEEDFQETVYKLAQSFAASMNNPLGRQMLSVLISTLAGSGQVSDAYWEQHALPKAQKLGQLLEPFRKRESIREDVNLELIPEFVTGYIIYQLLLKPDAGDLDANLRAGIDMLLHGIKEKR